MGIMKQRYDIKFFSIARNGLYQLRVAANRYFPRLIGHPYPVERLEALRSTDSRMNDEHSPPIDEYIDLTSIWAIEYYTPAHMDELFNRLKEFDWSGDESQDPVRWLQNRRSSQFSQAWKRLGPIVSRDMPRTSFLPYVKADLPPNVRYAYGDLYSFTPSLVGIALQFVFDEEFSPVFDNALRRERKTYVTVSSVSPRSFRIHDPENQRTYDIEQIRRDIKRLVADWFAKNLPGLCSSGLLDGDFPTCEFVTLRKAIPFPTREEYDGDLRRYLRHLGLSSSYDTWHSPSLAGLRFSPSSRNRDAADFHSILSINEASWEEQASGEEEESSRESRIYKLHIRVSSMCGIWALGALLQGYAQYFGKLRSSEVLRSEPARSAVASLQRIGENLSYSVDVAIVTEELAALVEAKRPLGLDVESFVPCSDAPDYWWKGSLEQLIQRQVGEKANWLRSMENAVRHHLTQHGTILGVVEDIRVQTKIAWLTYAILALTVVLAVLTLITAGDSLPFNLWPSRNESSLGQ